MERVASLEERVTALYALLDERLNSAKEAIIKAEVAAEKRFESINEFRAALADQQSHFVRKDELTIRFIALEDKINMLYNLQLEQKGKLAAQNLLWTYFMGAVGFFGVIATFVQIIYKK